MRRYLYRKPESILDEGITGVDRKKKALDNIRGLLILCSYAKLTY